EDGMVQAIKDISELRATFEEGVVVHDKGEVFNTDLTYAIEVGYLLEMADVLARCGVYRKESRGAHSRTDFPERDDENWLCHTIPTRTQDDPAFEITTAPVTITKHQPKVRTY